MKWRTSLACLMLIMLSGCGHHWIEDMWGDLRPDVEDPEPTPAPVVEVGNPFSLVYHGVAADGWPPSPGIVICTEDLVTKFVPVEGRGSCVSFVHCKLTFEVSGEAVVGWAQLEPRNVYREGPHCACPGGAKNWTRADDHGNENAKNYMYLTGYPQKQPGADGTWRGWIWMPIEYTPEACSIALKWRCTGARANRTYVGVCYRVEGIDYLLLYHWKQKWDGVENEYPERLLVEGLKFYR